MPDRPRPLGLAAPLRGLKGRLNWVLDRTIDLADLLLEEAYALPWAPARRLVQGMARAGGDLAWLLRDLPRLTAYRLAGEGWTIVFVGSSTSLPELRHLFFPGGANEQELGRVALWRLQASSRQWLAEGADLVVCESSRLFRPSLRARWVFVTPTWVRQALGVPTPPERLIRGGSKRDLRKIMIRGERNGFAYRVGQSPGDLHDFHYHMYLPYIRARLGERALLTAYRKQQRTHRKGALLLITRGAEGVAGLLCRLDHGVCRAIAFGIRDADEALMQYHLGTLADWFAITWASERGARIVDLGGSRSWCSDGVFLRKSHWGTQVGARDAVRGAWTILADALSATQREDLDRIGFISEIEGRFYRVVLATGMLRADRQCLGDALDWARNHGLAGLALVRPDVGPLLLGESANAPWADEEVVAQQEPGGEQP